MESILNPLIEELEKTARNLIAEVDVSGYKVSKMEVNPVGTQFRTFVQLEYNEEVAEKILMQKLMNNTYINSFKINI